MQIYTAVFANQLVNIVLWSVLKLRSFPEEKPMGCVVGALPRQPLSELQYDTRVRPLRLNSPLA